ncbi:MAG: glycosyltransferase family 2 protein [Planctomycetes bacterium]|nr:glycosyltransferase family 2 protein [Planctomycetota bacterium]
MKLSIIIVSWNVKKDLANCLRSIEENPASKPFEVIVVDNASSDGTVESVRNKFPEVVVIANSQNLGFAAANNQGIEKSQGEYILLLNPDTIVYSGSLEVLIEFMDENEDVGICGPRLLNNDGSIQRSARRYPSFRGALHRHTAFKFLGVFKGEYKKWLMKDFGQDEQKDVEQLMGAALIIRKSVLDKVGGMDERFFMYYEEVDLCYRIKQAGWRVVFLPGASITHLGGRSSEQVPVEKQLMAMTSLLKFFRKHRGKFITVIFCFIFKAAMAIGNIITIVVNAIIYLFALLTVNRNRKCKSAKKIKNLAMLLYKYLLL